MTTREQQLASRDAEIESLRQQLADMTKERDKAKAMPMKYRRMEFNAQLQNENESLRQQLAAALAIQTDGGPQNRATLYKSLGLVPWDNKPPACTDTVWIEPGRVDTKESQGSKP